MSVGVLRSDDSSECSYNGGVERRVEQLAADTGVSVDTIRYYQARGLLPPPRRDGRLAFYGEEHRQRLERIRALQARGLSLATIRRLLDGGLDPADAALVGAVADRLLPSDEPLLSLEELADHTGVPAPILQAVAERGLLAARRADGAVGFGTEDVAAVRAGLVLLEQGIPLGELLELAGAHDRAMRQVAERAVMLFDVYVRRPGREGDDGPGRDLAAVFGALLPATTTLVTHHFVRVLLEAAVSHIDHSADDDADQAAGA